MKLTVALLLLLPLTAACADTGDRSRTEVVTSVYPLTWIAERVGGEHIDLVNLSTAGQEPHDLELSVRQTAEVSGADVALFERDFQPAVDEAIGQAGDIRAVDVAELIELHEAGEHDSHDGHDDGGRDHEGHDHGGHDHGGHDHGGLDPHFWQDPTLMAEVAEKFAAELATQDPEHKAAYEANAKAVVEDLNTLDAEFTRTLKKCQTRTVVVSHDAFGYLARRYDLDVVPIAGLSPDAEPSPKQLAAVAKAAREAKVTTVFSETLASPAMAETLADELGVKTAVLDPLEGLAKGAKGDYLSLMRANLAALTAANRCA